MGGGEGPNVKAALRRPSDEETASLLNKATYPRLMQAAGWPVVCFATYDYTTLHYLLHHEEIFDILIDAGRSGGWSTARQSEGFGDEINEKS